MAIGDNYSIYHDPSNAHGEMRNRVQETPSPAPMARRAITFEAEWSGDGDLPPDTQLIRDFGECPERLVKKIRDHYIKLKEAVQQGKHLGQDGYFCDPNKWADVWSVAMQNGFQPEFSNVVTFPGSVYVRESATLTAPALTEVSGYVDVREGATLTAPKLTKSGSVYVREGATLTAPKLKR